MVCITMTSIKWQALQADVDYKGSGQTALTGKCQVAASFGWFTHSKHTTTRRTLASICRSHLCHYPSEISNMSDHFLQRHNWTHFPDQAHFIIHHHRE